MKIKLFCDGGSRGNPGPAAYGYVVYSPAGKVLEKCGNYLGLTTNNQAEYAGLLAGLEWILAHHPDSSVDITLDSLLVVNQIKGIYKVKSPDILPKFREARALLARLPGFTIRHTLRGGNVLADQLVNEALDTRA